MTPIQRIIYEEIMAKKFITIERYMELALYHQEFGYYMTKDPFGQEGDFTTSPEISQMFGEIIGAWIIDAWTQLGSPKPFQLVEFGAGRGTLMRDIYSVINKIPALKNNIKMVIIDCSLKLIQAQRELLHGIPVQWHSSLSEVEQIPTFIFGNEFFDALPIRQFILINNEWYERCVAWDNTHHKFFFDNIPLKEKPALVHELNVMHGVIYEGSESQKRFMEEICKFIHENSGVFLTFDYGYSNGQGDTLQSLSNHQYVDVLSNPSQNDITSHVNFGCLRDVAKSKNLNCSSIQTQGAFLKECGIEHRAAYLIDLVEREASDHKNKVIEDIKIAKSRLIDKDQMGTLFKVIAVSSQSDFKFIGFT